MPDAMKSTCFKFEKTLGRGSFGTTYLVVSRSDNKRYVIKEQFNTSYPVIQNEVKLLRKMHHPHVIGYFDFWREGEGTFILMEYATRGTLRQFLNRLARPLKEADALYLFSQIVVGVHHIHKRSVVHRDLKPENIMLSGHHGNVVKIGDFGVSQEVDSEPEVRLAGTKIYMAPEVLQGHIHGYKSDLWSLGVIFYEMLTKSFPFNVENEFQITNQICHGIVRPLPRNLVSYNCTKLSRCLLRRNPQERPRTRDLVSNTFLLHYIMRVYLTLNRTEKLMMLDIKDFSAYIKK